MNRSLRRTILDRQVNSLAGTGLNERVVQQIESWADQHGHSPIGTGVDELAVQQVESCVDEGRHSAVGTVLDSEVGRVWAPGAAAAADCNARRCCVDRARARPRPSRWGRQCHSYLTPILLTDVE